MAIDEFEVTVISAGSGDIASPVLAASGGLLAETRVTADEQKEQPMTKFPPINHVALAGGECRPMPRSIVRATAGAFTGRNTGTRVRLGIIVVLALMGAAGGAGAAGPIIKVSGVSPVAGCGADAGQTGSVFVHSEVEPWIDVNPTDPNHLLATWQQDRWSNGGARALVTAASHDGGATWSSTVVPGLSVCSGGAFARTTDPWVSFAANGDLYASAYSLGSPTGDAVLISKSTDGGASWGPPKVISADYKANSFNDKESITADPTNPDVAYATWTWFNSPNTTASEEAFFYAYAVRGGVAFSRTTDGGATWETPRQIYEKANLLPSFAQIVVLPTGDLVNVFTVAKAPWASEPNANGTKHTFAVAVAKSGDQGATWSRPVEISPHVEMPLSDPETGDPIRANGTVDIAVDRVSGKLHVVWAQQVPGTSVNGVAVSTSVDGGTSWSAPVVVNQTPAAIAQPNRQAFLPSVAVKDDGTVAVTYYDLRANDAGADLRTGLFAVLCRPGALCSSEPGAWQEQTLTDSSFDLRQAPKTTRGYFIGDYTGLVAIGDAFIAAFSMPHAGDSSSVFVRRFE